MAASIVTASQTSVVKRNPVLIIVGGIGSLVHVGLALLLAFGVSLTNIQVGAIEGFIGVALSIILALVVNGQTTPYDPSVGNTPSAMALLRALEAEVNAGEQPTPPSGPVVEPPPEESPDWSDPPAEPVATLAAKAAPKAAPVKKTAKKIGAKKQAPTKKAAQKRR